jgi:hypothetical protein
MVSSDLGGKDLAVPLTYFALKAADTYPCLWRLSQILSTARANFKCRNTKSGGAIHSALREPNSPPSGILGQVQAEERDA